MLGIIIPVIEMMEIEAPKFNLSKASNCRARIITQLFGFLIQCFALIEFLAPMLDFKNLHNPPSPHLTNFILVAPQHSTPCGQSWLLIASYYAYLLPAPP